MLRKEQILRVLRKYGFYSLNRAPYLYQNNEEWGVYFVWPHKHYGNLERVLSFDEEKLLEEEIYKYWWFLNNKNKLNIEVSFDDYEILSPHVFYKYKDTLLTAEIMKNFEREEKSFVDESTILEKKRLIRTANILIDILTEKFKLQYETYLKVLGLQDDLNKLTVSYQKKFNQYNNISDEVPLNCELLEDRNDESEKVISSLQKELSGLDSIDKISYFITTLYSYLCNIELNSVHLQNLYLLNRYPFEIEDIQKKISVLDKALKSRRKVLKGKKTLNDILKEIDEASECQNMMDIYLYVENEQKSIQDKYKNLEQIDQSNLGDALLELDKIDINVPVKIESADIEYLSKEKLFSSLKTNYENLNSKEKMACHIASSFLGECLNYLMNIDRVETLSVSDIISRLILNKKIDCFNENFHYLDNYMNAKVRVKYLNVLKVDTFENFIESLVETIYVLRKIEIKLKKGFEGYFYTRRDEIIPIYLKNFNFLEKDYISIAHVMPNVSLYYSPIQIVKSFDSVENEELIIRENETVFLLKHKVHMETKLDKIRVAKFEKDKVVKNKDCVIILGMKKKNTCNYYEDNISSIESEGIR